MTGALAMLSNHTMYHSPCLFFLSSPKVSTALYTYRDTHKHLYRDFNFQKSKPFLVAPSSFVLSCYRNNCMCGDLNVCRLKETLCFFVFSETTAVLCVSWRDLMNSFDLTLQPLQQQTDSLSGFLL